MHKLIQFFFVAFATLGPYLATYADETPPLVITESVVLEPGKSYGRIVIKASDIVIDGNGAIVDGGESPSNKRQGIAIESQGSHRVTLKNIKARGWDTALRLQDCSEWTIEGCDFSDNFHDPDFGWGENGRRGGILLMRTVRSKLLRNQAHRVWDACVLVDSHENLIEQNDFSHTSNTCLKFWQATRNSVINNNFSYGIRKKPDEVHARDSTGVLIESGSNDNRFVGNDCKYGGDGIFVRVLNRWCSTGNVFEGNDCSYANNNGFECWAPRNTFVRNKANHCSYGFWLGGSDQTILDGNEASDNGLAEGNHNSPHLPNKGHAGIVFMFGPSSHVVAYGNRCERNNGAGIALIGDQASKGQKWKAFHWLIENNNLVGNRWGVYAQSADWIELDHNYMADNEVSQVESTTGVTRLTNRHPRSEPTMGPGSLTPRLTIDVPSQTTVGQSIQFNARAVALPAANLEWDFGKGMTVSGPTPQQVFDAAGFYRVGVTAKGETAAQIGWLDLYVTDDLPELADEPDAWRFTTADKLNCTFQRDAQVRLVGKDSIKVDIDPYHGGLAQMNCSLAKLGGKTSVGKRDLVFWLRAINHNLPGWQSNNPEVTLAGKEGERMVLKPKQDLLSQPTYNEARDGWQMIVVPLTSHEGWEVQGNLPKQIETVSIGLDSWDAGPLQVWIDGLVLRD